MRPSRSKYIDRGLSGKNTIAANAPGVRIRPTTNVIAPIGIQHVRMPPSMQPMPSLRSCVRVQSRDASCSPHSTPIERSLPSASRLSVFLTSSDLIVIHPFHVDWGAAGHHDELPASLTREMARDFVGVEQAHRAQLLPLASVAIAHGRARDTDLLALDHSRHAEHLREMLRRGQVRVAEGLNDPRVTEERLPGFGVVSFELAQI